MMLLSTRARPWLSALLLALAVLAVALVLTLLNPFAAGSMLPPCPFHALTGLFCPGCGTTRALHALFRADIVLAFSMNPLAVIAFALMPLLLWNTWQPRRRILAVVSDARLWLPGVLAFMVLRNLPWIPFSWLAPG